MALSIVVAFLVISGMATIASLVCDDICFAEDDFEIDLGKRKCSRNITELEKNEPQGTDIPRSSM